LENHLGAPPIRWGAFKSTAGVSQNIAGDLNITKQNKTKQTNKLVPSLIVAFEEGKKIIFICS
jgi:hypothetical protein